MTRRGLTVEELAASQRMPVYLVADVLREEQARGHVEQHGGLWTATAALVDTYGPAFGYLAQNVTERTPGLVMADTPW